MSKCHSFFTIHQFAHLHFISRHKTGFLPSRIWERDKTKMKSPNLKSETKHEDSLEDRYCTKYLETDEKQKNEDLFYNQLTKIFGTILFLLSYQSIYQFF